MANPGSITDGTGEPEVTLDQACDRLRTLEWLCELHVKAHLIGTPQVVTADQLNDVSSTTARLREVRGAAG